MSLPSIHQDSPADTDASLSDHPLYVKLTRPFEAMAFWSAVALPFLYVPLLIRGLESSAQTTAFFVLLALHAIAVVVGHRYKRE